MIYYETSTMIEQKTLFLAFVKRKLRRIETIAMNYFKSNMNTMKNSEKLFSLENNSYNKTFDLKNTGKTYIDSNTNRCGMTEIGDTKTYKSR